MDLKSKKKKRRSKRKEGGEGSEKEREKKIFLNGFLSCAAHHGQRGVAQRQGYVDKRKTEKGYIPVLT